MFKYCFCTFSSFRLGPQLKHVRPSTLSLSSVFSIFSPSVLCSKSLFTIFQFTNSLFGFFLKSLLNPYVELLNLVILFFFIFFLVLEILFGSFSDLQCLFLYLSVPCYNFQAWLSLHKHSKYSYFMVCVC